MTLQQRSSPYADYQFEVDMRQPAPVWHIGIWLFFYFAGMLLAIWSAFMSHEPAASEHPHLVVLYVLDLTASFVVFFYIWWGLRRQQFPLAELIGFRWRSWRDTLLAIGVVAGNWSMVYALYYLFGQFSIRHSPILGAPQSSIEFLALALVLGGAGFFEELEFRGYLLRQVLSLTGSRSLSITIQALLFSIAHGFNQTYVSFAAKFAFGWILGEIAVRRRSLLPGMLAHSMNNLLVLVLMVRRW